MLQVTARVRRPYVDRYNSDDATTYYNYSVVETCRPLAVEALKSLVNELQKQGLKIVDTFIHAVK